MHELHEHDAFSVADTMVVPPEAGEPVRNGKTLPAAAPEPTLMESLAQRAAQRVKRAARKAVAKAMHRAGDWVVDRVETMDRAADRYAQGGPLLKPSARAAAQNAGEPPPT